MQMNDLIIPNNKQDQTLQSFFDEIEDLDAPSWLKELLKTYPVDILQHIPALFINNLSLKVFPVELFTFFKADSLLSIDLSYNEMRTLPFHNILEEMPNLQHINVSYNFIERFDDILKLSKHPNLISINFDNNPFPEANQRILCIQYMFFVMLGENNSKFDISVLDSKPSNDLPKYHHSMTSTKIIYNLEPLGERESGPFKNLLWLNDSPISYNDIEKGLELHNMEGKLSSLTKIRFNPLENKPHTEFNLPFNYSTQIKNYLNHTIKPSKKGTRSRFQEEVFGYTEEKLKKNFKDFQRSAIDRLRRFIREGKLPGILRSNGEIVGAIGCEEVEEDIDFNSLNDEILNEHKSLQTVRSLKFFKKPKPKSIFEEVESLNRAEDRQKNFRVQRALASAKWKPSISNDKARILDAKRKYSTISISNSHTLMSPKNVPVGPISLDTPTSQQTSFWSSRRESVDWAERRASNIVRDLNTYEMFAENMSEFSTIDEVSDMKTSRSNSSKISSVSSQFHDAIMDEGTAFDNLTFEQFSKICSSHESAALVREIWRKERKVLLETAKKLRKKIKGKNSVGLLEKFKEREEAMERKEKYERAFDTIPIILPGDANNSVPAVGSEHVGLKVHQLERRIKDKLEETHKKVYRHHKNTLNYIKNAENFGNFHMLPRLDPLVVHYRNAQRQSDKIMRELTRSHKEEQIQHDFDLDELLFSDSKHDDSLRRDPILNKPLDLYDQQALLAALEHVSTGFLKDRVLEEIKRQLEIARHAALANQRLKKFMKQEIEYEKTIKRRPTEDDVDIDVLLRQNTKNTIDVDVESSVAESNNRRLISLRTQQKFPHIYEKLEQELNDGTIKHETLSDMFESERSSSDIRRDKRSFYDFESGQTIEYPNEMQEMDFEQKIIQREKKPKQITGAIAKRMLKTVKSAARLRKKTDSLVMKYRKESESLPKIHKKFFDSDTSGTIYNRNTLSQGLSVAPKPEQLRRRQSLALPTEMIAQQQNQRKKRKEMNEFDFLKLSMPSFHEPSPGPSTRNTPRKPSIYRSNMSMI
ncbi:hypothetical protein PCE1_000389 [Barthelona sp. PCE]